MSPVADCRTAPAAPSVSNTSQSRPLLQAAAKRDRLGFVDAQQIDQFERIAGDPFVESAPD